MSGLNNHQNAFDFDAKRLARKSDPSTSHAAAKSMGGAIGPQHEEILAVLADGVPRADEQISGILGKDTHRRMKELVDRGLIERTGEDDKHRNRTGRMAFKYKIVRGN